MDDFSQSIEKIGNLNKMIIEHTIPKNKCQIFSDVLQNFDSDCKKILQPKMKMHNELVISGKKNEAKNVDHEIWNDMTLGAGLGSMLVSHGQIMGCVKNTCPKQCDSKSVLGLSKIKNSLYSFCFCDNKFKKDKMFEVKKYNGGTVNMQGTDAMIFEYLNSLK